MKYVFQIRMLCILMCICMYVLITHSAHVYKFICVCICIHMYKMHIRTYTPIGINVCTMHICTVHITENFTYCIVIVLLHNVIALFCNVVTNGIE